MKEFFEILKYEIEKPNNFGLFHLVSLAIVVAVTTLICIRFKNCSDKTFRRIALISWLIMLVLEIYKQVVFTFDYTDKGLVGDYQWYAFPFQLCSTPLYILPFVAFMKEGKVRDYFTSFISTFSLFGGLVVLLYPNDVFVTTLGINIQTMVHHGLQIMTGVFFAVYNRKKLNIKYFLKSILVFVGLLIIACLLNEIVYPLAIDANNNITFNMFYVSSHFANHLPILSFIYASVPYIAFLLLYLVGFIVTSLVIFYSIVGVMKLVLIHKKHAKE